MNFQIFKLDLAKAEEPEIKCQYLLDHQKSKMFQKNIYFCCIDYAKAFDWVDHNKLWKILKDMEYQTTWHPCWEVCMQVKKQQSELLEPEQQTGCFLVVFPGSKSVKEYIKAVYCHPAYLTYIQSTSWEMLGWKKHKLESRLPGEI